MIADALIISLLAFCLIPNPCIATLTQIVRFAGVAAFVVAVAIFIGAFLLFAEICTAASKPVNDTREYVQ